MVDLEVLQEQKGVRLGSSEETEVVFVDLKSGGGCKDYSRTVRYCSHFLVEIDLRKTP